MSYIDYADSGFHIFGLHGATNGKCNCGNPDCKALFKHPIISGWQKTPKWSQEQLDHMDEKGDFDTGFGFVIRHNLLIVDIDPRNGGAESMKKLPPVTNKDCVVATGGGGWHRYYLIPVGMALKSKHEDYPGIDFKTSGFCVGYGSMHASGREYALEQGSLDNIQSCPPELLKALEKPEYHRTEHDGQAVDVTDSDIQNLLGYISPDCDYEEWVRVGMAIHKVTSGDGLGLWDEWSSKGDKYNPAEMDSKWHSFGKSLITVGFGTLHYYAEQGGYKPSVTFTSDIVIETPEQASHIDLLRPPGLVGKLAEWMRSQCRYPREKLVTAAALTTIGNLAGLKYTDDYGATANLFTFCVAGSATGKDNVMDAMGEALFSAGMSGGINGTIKSEQEIVRSLIKQKASCYVIDEIGILLSKISNAKGGSSSYLEGITGMLMQVYSKANKRMPLGHDVRVAAQADVVRELAAIQKKIDENETYNEERFEELKQLLVDLEFGLNKPFLSLIGFTTPVTFQGLVNYEQAANGFIGRSLLVQEKETNPRLNKSFNPSSGLPMGLQMALARIWQDSSRGMDKVAIQSTEAARARLEGIHEYFYEYSERQKNTSLESVSRRAFELVLKISLILAVCDGVRTVEHVEWAFEYIKQDIDAKINLAAANMAYEVKDYQQALGRKIYDLLDTQDEMSPGVLANRLRQFKKEDVLKMIETMIETKTICRTERKNQRGKPTILLKLRPKLAVVE